MEVGTSNAHPGECAEAQLGLVTLVDTYTLKPVGAVLAHRSPVQALCLNPTGQLLATASTKGTVIRVFAVPSLDLVCAFRRGSVSCRIFGLLFSRDSTHICASASSGTVHIFKNSEKVLDSLPLQSEDATVGAAQREMISKTAPAGGGIAETPPSTQLSPAGGQLSRERSVGELSGPARHSGQVSLGPIKADVNRTDCTTLDNDFEDLSDWHVVDERPERMLELYVNTPSCSSTCTSFGARKNAIQTLSAVSEFAVENTARYAKSLLQMLPQPCRELVDAPRAFAWVHLREQEELRTGGVSTCIGGGISGGFVACVNSRPRGSPGDRVEVLVATARGCAHVYDLSATAGGECRLRTEHSFAFHSLQHDRPAVPPFLSAVDAKAEEPSNAAVAEAAISTEVVAVA